VRLAFSGSAPIPAELITWYRKLGLQLFEGYGMTEDFAYSHASTEQANAPGYVGVPFEGVEVRIGENDEVLIKSPGQMVGYYKRPDLNTEVFTSDGFFRTGDKGERRPNGLSRRCSRPPRENTSRRRPSRTGSTNTQWSNYPWSPVPARPLPMQWWCWPKTCAAV
jgi:acyl-CoA synthetase (AMP-forming)/AMP-acid ligase II